MSNASSYGTEVQSSVPNRLIKTVEEYRSALARIDDLIGAEPGSPESEELEFLVALVEFYETKACPIGPPDPIEAIEFRMKQAGLSQKDLVPYIGSRAKVSEILSGKRPITLKMARALHAGLGVPAEVLLREPRARLPGSSDLDPPRFPWHEMVSRGWLPSFHGSTKAARARATELLPQFLSVFSRDDVMMGAFRPQVRGAASMDSYSLLAWTARITDLALRNPIPTRFMPGSIDQTFVRHLVGLSCLDEGARLAREFLNKHGIHLVVEPQLPNARLDGAAALLPGFVPVIGMTLRHDRLSRFWYCLCHELAHIALHSADDGTSWFVDDLDLRDVTTIEQEADAWTDLALTEQWRPERRRYSTNEVRSIAASLKVHPAIVAGRIRRATSNFRALSQLVGRGLVHRQFTQVNWPPDPRRQRATDRSKGSNPRQRPHPLS